MNLGKCLAMGVLTGIALTCYADSKRIKAPKANKESAKADYKKLKIDKSLFDGQGKAKRKFKKGNFELINMAYSIQKPYVKEEKELLNGKEYIVKTAKFDNGRQSSSITDKINTFVRKNILRYKGDRYVRATYDELGNLESVEINSNRTRKFYESDIKYTKNVAYADTDRKKAGYEVKITEGYDFDTVSKLTTMIFNKDRI